MPKNTLKAKGEVRHQFTHAIDMVPTVLEALDIEPPTQIRGVTQSPIEGVSFGHCQSPTKVHEDHGQRAFVFVRVLSGRIIRPADTSTSCCSIEMCSLRSF
jgi:arylsulfatase A-like enzyme